jgi:succinate-semialdehyde dehydrogenase/glutarate-semialdehyde dehydrogenase
MLTLSPLIAAIGGGNVAVLKPSEVAPATAAAIARHMPEYLDREAFSAVLGAVPETTALLEQQWDHIFFTGGTAVAKVVMAAAAKNLTPVVLELGGKDAAVVCHDADLDRAAKGVVWGAFVNAGQTCASVERVYVEQAVAEAFTAKVVEETRRLRVGDPAADEVDVGPMTMERQRRTVEEHVADAVARGARVVAGGATPAGPGYFYPPTVLTGVDHTMRIMREETFGPVLPIMAVPSLDEAIRLANDSDYGLTASGWTRDAETARRLERELQAGVVTINDCVYSYGEPTAPWGGVKQSGIGRTHGVSGLREMVQVKYVAREFGGGADLWWYPYGAEFHRFMSTANRALHGRSFWTRMAAQLRLLRFGRFWRRARLLGLVKNADKLF